MSIDFSGTEYENEDLEPLVTTSLTREDGHINRMLWITSCIS